MSRCLHILPTSHGSSANSMDLVSIAVGGHTSATKSESSIPSALSSRVSSVSYSLDSAMRSSHKTVDSALVSTLNFLFVDHQQGNPQGTSIEKQKLVFAQRNYQRKKNLAAVERLKTSTQVFRQRLPFTYVSASDSPGDTKDSHQTMQIIAMMTEFLSPTAYLGQGFVDPFSSSVLPMTDNMNSYFRHLRNYTIQQSYPLDGPRMSIWWWQKAITQPAIQQALLYSAASHQTALNTLNNVPSKSIQRSISEFLRLCGDTFKTLNEILRDPEAVAEPTVLIVAFLQAISANFEGIAAHTKGLATLIRLLGGLDALDHMTLSKIYQYHERGLNNTQPTLLLMARWRSEILQETEPFLHVFQRLIQYYEVAQPQPSLIMPTDNDLFVVFEHQLLSIRYTAANNLKEPLHISQLIYLNLLVWHFQSFPIMQHMVETLRQILMSCTTLTHFKETAPNLLFWILYTGGMVSQGHQGHLWFVTHLAEMIHHLGLDEWANARLVLGGFFYTEQPEENGGPME
ncbi:hypothetical protein BDW59DRAFT_168452 [Aspergillus cavernicola]|uniref:Transcription factor domain-containing protein n=1 Tax=Aspergillus cavernicola TaxID=176166 RepID=A0ABR4J5W9_9EURO